jgi:hypothetical protein
MSTVLDNLKKDAFEEHHLTLPTGEIFVVVQESLFELDALMGFAARANAKRGFLFLSKVLGKHWPAKPKLMEAIHVGLAAQIPGNLSGPLVFIAMAETAIGLGQGVFEAYLKANPDYKALFLHTSRYQVGEAPVMEFEESHSHAPRQFLHMPEDASLREILMTATTLVLIDDEASTGNTFLNLTEACRTLNPGINKIHLATITNFMGTDVNTRLSERFGLDVTIGSTLSGHYRFVAGQTHPPDSPAQLFEAHADRGASGAFGRVGLDRPLTVPTELAKRLASQIQADETVLVLGTGEFMHPAFLLARDLEDCGIDVVVQSTTRSPILQWGAVTHAITFPDNYGEGIANFIYNVAPAQYDHIFICHETPPGAALFQLAHSLEARLFHFQSESQVEEISIR